MPKTEIKIESVEEFIERGRKRARLADRGLPIPESRVIAFGDVETLLQILSGKRHALLKQIKHSPGSISDLAKKLKRDRSAVTRDVQFLQRHGVLNVTERPLPGHGRQKWISPVARDLKLTAEF